MNNKVNHDEMYCIFGAINRLKRELSLPLVSEFN